jgi:hypothetical protein
MIDLFNDYHAIAIFNNNKTTTLFLLLNNTLWLEVEYRRRTGNQIIGLPCTLVTRFENSLNNLFNEKLGMFFDSTESKVDSTYNEALHLMLFRNALVKL